MSNATRPKSGGNQIPLLYNPFDPGFKANPYPTYHALREQDPVHYSPLLKRWVLSRYQDAERALKSPKVVMVPPRGGESELHRTMGEWLPHHPQLRGLMAQAFTPKVIRDLQPRIQALVDGLLNNLRERTGPVDIAGDFAHPLPLMVIADMLGVPDSDRASFKDWALAMERGIDGVFMGRPDPEANDAAKALKDYFRALVAERIKNPGADLISRLALAEENGVRLSEEQIVCNCVLFFFAGHETTGNQIGSGIHLLLESPGELAKLLGQPDGWMRAVEEILRLEPAVQMTARMVKEPIQLGERWLEAGQELSILLGAVNRDPEVFPDPDRMDLGRDPNPQLAFSVGAHYCLGAGLARAEARIALRSLWARYPRIRSTGQPPVWKDHFALRGPQALLVSLHDA
jgi:cytochrome P450